MNIKNIIKEEFNNIVNENGTHNIFLGYHSSDGVMEKYEQPELLDEKQYDDVIRNIYNELFNNPDDIDISDMNEKFEELGFGFLFVSTEPIKASPYQASKYKYGDYLYEIYGTGKEHVFDDPNELNAEIIMTKEPLHFKNIDSPE